MAKLIISYDCEGVWGMLDTIDTLDKNIFNRDSLLQIYQDLIKLHEAYSIKATFAFVGALISNKEEFFQILNTDSQAKYCRKWCEPIILQQHNFSDEDIFIPELLNIVRESEVEHEIASHGFSHTIMDSLTDEESLLLELKGIKEVAKNKDFVCNTIIFPRNIVNNRFLDKADFLKSFRRGPKTKFKSRLLKRAHSLLKEFIPFCSSEELDHYNGKISIPGDFFINWRSGLRKYVPIWLTILRFKSALNHAVKNEGIVHIWMHPHNLATGNKQIELLEELFMVIQDYRDQGKLTVQTQNKF